MWFVYILKCSDESFYTGITDDLTKRTARHNEGKASRYTRCRLPVNLVYWEKAGNRSEASIREAAIKKMSRHEKKLLVDRC